MNALYVFQLRFDGERGVEHAFRTLLDTDDLDDCTVEPDDGLIRFTADVERGQALVAGIYEMGELRWCSRHRLQPGSTTSASVGTGAG